MFESLAIQDAARHAQQARAETDRLPRFVRDAQQHEKKVNGETLAMQDARQNRAKMFSGVFVDHSDMYRGVVTVG
jgi:hypothetical protein